jgi:MFS_1 like family
MGIIGIVTSVSEFVASLVVDYVINLIGHSRVMYLGLLAYVIRFVVYGCVTNPWLVVPVEALQGKHEHRRIKLSNAGHYLASKHTR